MIFYSQGVVDVNSQLIKWSLLTKIKAIVIFLCLDLYKISVILELKRVCAKLGEIRRLPDLI